MFAPVTTSLGGVITVVVVVVIIIAFRHDGVGGTGITTHIEGAQRMSAYFDVQSQGNDYRTMLLTNQDSVQAGATYPDAFWSRICYQSEYRNISEDSHWTPFLNASVNYIRRQYPLPWDEATQKLVVFIMAVASHQVADASWHSHDIEQGYLKTMAQVNFNGDFALAHQDADVGADIMNLFQINMDYIASVVKWYVPAEDLAAIYAELYGDPDRVTREVIENCTKILFIERLGENLGFIDWMYPLSAGRSPFLTDLLNNFFLGGVDDMATRTGNYWKETVTMLDYGTEVCELPRNPLYVHCSRPSGHRPPDMSWHRHFSDEYADLLTFVTSWFEPDDVLVERNDRGIYFSPSERLQRLLKMKVQMMRESASYSETDGLNRTASVFYETQLEYSRLGQKLTSGDVNGDGYTDLIVSAPGFSDLNNYQQGRVYIVYGSEDGIPNTSFNIETSADVILSGPEINGRFGTSTAVVDLNADGINDLAVSAPSVGSETLDFSGQVYVYFGQSDGTVSTAPSVTIGCTEHYCNVGWTLASGDINADGFMDLIIGSPFAPSGGAQRGMIALLYASTSYQPGTTLTESNFDWRYDGEQDYEWLGYSINAAQISTGETWLAAGAPTYRLCVRSDCAHDLNDTQSLGRIHVFRSTSLSQPVRTLTGRGPQFSQFGSYVGFASIAGVDVLLVSSITTVGGESNSTEPGVVELFRITKNIVDSEPFATLSGDMEFDRFGQDVKVFTSRIDGLDHILVSAPHRSDSVRSQREAGRVFEFYAATNNSADQADMTYLMDDDQSRFGSSVVVVESLQKQQLVVGAQHSSLPRTGELTVHRLTGRLAVFDL